MSDPDIQKHLRIKFLGNLLEDVRILSSEKRHIQKIDRDARLVLLMPDLILPDWIREQRDNPQMTAAARKNVGLELDLHQQHNIDEFATGSQHHALASTRKSRNTSSREASESHDPPGSVQPRSRESAAASPSTNLSPPSSKRENPYTEPSVTAAEDEYQVCRVMKAYSDLRKDAINRKSQETEPFIRRNLGPSKMKQIHHQWEAANPHGPSKRYTTHLQSLLTDLGEVQLSSFTRSMKAAFVLSRPEEHVESRKIVDLAQEAAKETLARERRQATREWVQNLEACTQAIQHPADASTSNSNCHPLALSQTERRLSSSSQLSCHSNDSTEAVVGITDPRNENTLKEGSSHPSPSCKGCQKCHGSNDDDVDVPVQVALYSRLSFLSEDEYNLVWRLPMHVINRNAAESPHAVKRLLNKISGWTKQEQDLLSDCIMGSYYSVVGNM